MAYFGNRTPIPEEKIETQESVEVQVGSGKGLKIFIVNKSLLCSASAYCRIRLAPELKIKEQAIILNGFGFEPLIFEPLIFEIFLQWISNPAPRIAYDPDGLPQEPWLSNAATAWLLGRKLECSDDFDKYALSQFIQNCAFMLFGPWELIEKQATKGSLCRFSDHWVAWNYQFAGPEPNEYSGLRATRVPTKPISDPRIYDIEHWYSECGKYMRPKCLHDPITRMEKSEEANRPKPFPPAHWGHYTEFKREVCLAADLWIYRS